MRKAASSLRAVALFIACAAPAAALGEPILFKSPSGNISCVMNAVDGGYAFCSLAVEVQSYTDRPADCDGDWGNHFAVAGAGAGALGCVTDHFGFPDFVLPYGARIAYSGVTCRSERTGVSCENADGGGFAISRRRQSVY